MRKSFFQKIFEDEDIVVINKSAGVYTIPERRDRAAPNLLELLSREYGKIYVVHRLDKDTSGVVIFAKNPKAHKFLNERFFDRSAKRIYKAVILGKLSEDYLEIDIPLIENYGRKFITIPSARGKESLTIVKTVEKFRRTSLVECDLATGRRHQIRAHLAAVGNSLLVDPIYGDRDAFYLSSIKRRYNKGKNEEEKPIISRLTMHAEKLKIKTPKDGLEKEFKADYPRDFAALLSVLRKYDSLPDYLKL